jgi:hypothetical protein
MQCDSRRNRAELVDNVVVTYEATPGIGPTIVTLGADELCWNHRPCRVTPDD